MTAAQGGGSKSTPPKTPRAVKRVLKVVRKDCKWEVVRRAFHEKRLIEVLHMESYSIVTATFRLVGWLVTWPAVCLQFSFVTFF